MKCPNCGVAELVHDTRDMPYTYKGETTTIAQVTGDFCPACGEAVLEFTESLRTSREMLDFNQQVNRQAYSPEKIREVREKLRLNQQEAAALFGGGINAFSRYETGRTTPPVPLIQLFRLLDHHPDMLDELKDNAA